MNASLLNRCYCAAAEKAKYNSEENSMKTDVSKFSEFRKYYLSEFEWFDGEEYITFNSTLKKAKPKSP